MIIALPRWASQRCLGGAHSTGRPTLALSFRYYSVMDDHDFLSGGGEMGALIRAHDWAASPLGEPGSWPQGLKTSVRVLLSTGHPMFIWWGPELIQFYNDAYRRSIGPERHPSAVGQPARECWAEIWDIIGPQIEQVMEGRGYTWHENQLVPITRYGKREDVYWTYSYGPIDEPTAPHGVGGVLVVCTETTEQVFAEQRLKAAEARWRALFEQTPGFVAILSGPRHVFEFANPNYFKLIGGRHLLGKSLREALPDVAAQGFVELLDEVYRSGEPHVGVATSVFLEHGPNEGRERRYLDFVYQPVHDAAGGVTGIFVNGYDVTERVLASDSLRDEDRRKDEFLAMLGHELRNPLSAIQNASELLVRNAASDASTRMVGELLARQVTQLGKLVDDLLDLSRISQGRIELQREPVELGSAIALALESVEPLVRTKRHEVLNAGSTVPLYVNGDPSRIVQAISNVITNAAKYTEAGGRIEVTLEQEGQSAVIAIADNGVGMSPELLPNVFDLFVQGSRTAERSEGGLGIGLSLVRRLVEMHGGQVAAASDGVGCGSTFQIRLPLSSAPAPSVAAWSGERRIDLRRVLVVDDNADAADSLAALLRISGHDAETAYTGRDALERMRRSHADVVLLDIGLPEMDGYEVARRIRAEHGALVLVAVTGYGQAADVRRAEDAGFDAHITKPVAFEELQRVLAEL
jgi:signal transduction histidine kinase/CheY-like chemotaxis protein